MDIVFQRKLSKCGLKIMKIYQLRQGANTLKQKSIFLFEHHYPMITRTIFPLSRSLGLSILLQSTGCFTSSCIRNRAVVSMFWDLWQPKGLLCHPKTGRKLLLGQKCTQMALTMSQEDSQKTNKIKIWQFKLDFQGVPKWIFASIIHSSHIIN